MIDLSQCFDNSDLECDFEETLFPEKNTQFFFGPFLRREMQKERKKNGSFWISVVNTTK